MLAILSLMYDSIGPYAPVFLPGKPPSLTEKLGKPQSIGSQRVRHYRSDPVCIATRFFLPVAVFFFFFPSELRVKVAQLLGLRVPC